MTLYDEVYAKIGRVWRRATLLWMGMGLSGRPSKEYWVWRRGRIYYVPRDHVRPITD